MADRFVWTAADGTSIDLTDEAAGYSVLANGTRGLRSVEYAFTTAEFAGADGVQVQAVKASANTPTLGLIVQADSEDEFIAKSRALVRSMRPKAGPGTLTVYRGDGSSRSLNCYVTAGLEGDEAVDVTLPGSWWKFALKLMAPSPWWEGDPVTVDFGLAAPAVFLSPTLQFPRTLSSSTIQGQQTIDLSQSDAPSYPTWTVTGPGTGLTLTNRTTGRVIQVNGYLGDGLSMTIDTRPGRQSVRRSDGMNLMGNVSSDPALWPLIDGVNDVSAVFGSAGAAARIEAVYQPRYAGI